MTQCVCHIEREESFDSAQVLRTEDAEKTGSENTSLDNVAPENAEIQNAETVCCD